MTAGGRNGPDVDYIPEVDDTPGVDAATYAFEPVDPEPQARPRPPLLRRLAQGVQRRRPARRAAPDGSAPEEDGPAEAGHFGAAGLLAVHGLQKSYGGRMVVKEAALNVRNGEAVGLLGPNGAGKTTIFYMITGLVAADRGIISLDGHDITRLPMYRRARLGIGYLPQEASIFRGLNVEDNIRAVLEVTQPDRKERERELDQLLEEFHIARLRKAPSIALSGGERRRCEIARALAGRPSFMLLDEPFAGIDPIAVGDIQDLVRQLTRRGIGVLITDHNVRETLGLVDRAYIIHSGQVLMEGRAEDVIANPDVRRLYLGEDFRL
ncbi:LPS export ABC transporter ATP-binding protein [Chelatococcus reniformis]|uniref:ABC transporter ATP-binding protein n=1 Tax=Chelatococcus reniformis TaxID=1494448 RepID=A0A916TX01_9HYPH|nr:LPS export ABC transporter ATP-binding protein [Chelatococcus reniformis]GGC46593.1 ABC transporter ATP-binding protein [Chelatococcus reniformis]